MASQAERGMRIIEREAVPLKTPDDALLKEVYAKGASCKMTRGCPGKLAGNS
jgi:hypothetical protein